MNQERLKKIQKEILNIEKELKIIDERYPDLHMSNYNLELEDRLSALKEEARYRTDLLEDRLSALKEEARYRS